MNKVKKLYGQIGLILFFTTIFIITSNTIPEPDMWLHLVLGKVLSENGLIDHDLISQAAGRKWLPFEWSFQLLLFEFSRLFGISAIRFFIGVFATIQNLLVYGIIRSIFRLSSRVSVIICISYTLLLYTSFTARPQIVANALFLFNIYLIFLYIFRNKNFLLLSLPLTYLWSTFHATVFLGPVTIFLYGVVCLAYALLIQENIWMIKAKKLLLFSVLSFGIILLPPIGGIQIEHMKLYKEHFQLFQTVHEFQPLWRFSADFLFYTVVVALTGVGFIITMLRHRQKYSEIAFLFLPLILLVLFGYFALRNTDYGFIGLLLILSWCIARFNTDISKVKKVIAIVSSALLISILAIVLYLRLQEAPSHVPEQAARFLADHSLKGNMFHDRAYGAYISYHLYPTYKVFIDGRADVHYCCEYPDYVNLLGSIGEQGVQFRKQLLDIVNTYAISFIVITYRENMLGNKILETLKNDPDWSLVYWDDYEAIMVNEVGKVKQDISIHRFRSATPFEILPYAGGMYNEAISEYQRMDTSYSSALTKNNLGIMTIEKGDRGLARHYFSDAINLDPEFPFAYANLATLETQEGNNDKALLLRIMYERLVEENTNH